MSPGFVDLRRRAVVVPQPFVYDAPRNTYNDVARQRLSPDTHTLMPRSPGTRATSRTAHRQEAKLVTNDPYYDALRAAQASVEDTTLLMPPELLAKLMPQSI